MASAVRICTENQAPPVKNEHSPFHSIKHSASHGQSPRHRYRHLERHGFVNDRVNCFEQTQLSCRLARDCQCCQLIGGVGAVHGKNFEKLIEQTTGFVRDLERKLRWTTNRAYWLRRTLLLVLKVPYRGPQHRKSKGKGLQRISGAGGMRECWSEMNGVGTF